MTNEKDNEQIEDNIEYNDSDDRIDSVKDINDNSIFSDDNKNSTTIKDKILAFTTNNRKKIWIWIISFVIILSLYLYYIFFWPIYWSWNIIEKESNLPVFNWIVIDTDITLHFIQQRWWIKIIWDDNIVEKIKFEVAWSELRIFKKWIKRFKPTQSIDVYVSSLSLNSITINWKTKILWDWNTLQSSDLRIITYWSSLVNIKLDVVNLHTIVYGSSILYYHWKADQHKIDIPWSAVLNTSRFITKETNISIKWNWVCDIFAWMKLSIDISWVWQVIYSWNPPDYKEKISWVWIVERNSN